MPKYALIDTNTPPMVVGYYDTDALTYPNLPALDTLVELSDSDWAKRNDGQWVIVADKLFPYVPPPPTVQQQAVALLRNPVVTLVCTSNAVLNADYSAGDSSRSNITGVAVAVNGGLGVPGGGATFNYPDVSGVAHAWPGDKFILFAKAIMDYIYAVSQVAGGNGSTLPSSTLTIG